MQHQRTSTDGEEAFSGRVYGLRPTKSDVIHLLKPEPTRSVCGAVEEIDIVESPWGPFDVFRLDNVFPEGRFCQRCLYSASSHGRPREWGQVIEEIKFKTGYDPNDVAYTQ